MVQDYGCYTIHFEGDGEANLNAANWISGELGLLVDAKGDTEVKEDAAHTHVEDLWDWLEPYVAAHPGAAFTLEGYIENHGYDEDFKVEAAGGSLSAYRSGWYYDDAKCTYESYEEFCEEWQDDDGNPLCSQDEYDALGDDLFLFETFESGDSKTIVLDEVPLDGPVTSRDDLMKCGM